jgi:hypothetical protein
MFEPDNCFPEGIICFKKSADLFKQRDKFNVGIEISI